MTQTARIVSYIEEPWGCATIYSTEPEEVDDPVVVNIDSKVFKAMSTMKAVVEDESSNTRSTSSRESLCYLTAALFGTIMEDAVTKLRILMECNNELRIIKTHSDMKQLVTLKYDIKQIPCTDELEGIDPHSLHCDQYKINKLDADRKYVTDTFFSTYIDICMNGNYDALETAINKILQRDNYRATIQEDEARNTLIRRELYKQLRQRRNHIKSAIYETNLTIEKLQTQVGDADLYNNCRSRYTDKWERARTEQHIQTIHDTDIVTTEVVEYYKRRTEQEQRVHSEVDLLINIIITETLERIEDWMAKYDKDIEKIDLKIRLKKNEYQTAWDNRLHLERTIEEHNTQMIDWCTFKEIREKARLYREKMTKSAIIVQSWWRGLLVRRNLGPYKVAKAKKGKK